MRQYLKKLRADKDVSQKTTADALGISQNYYCCIENGTKQKNIDLRILVKLSSFFDVSLEWLIEQENSLAENKGA